MSGFVTVDEKLFERQGVKFVLPGGEPPAVQLVPGELPGSDDEVLMHEGEPSFEVRLARSLEEWSDAPHEVVAALHRVVGRLHFVSRDGREGVQQDVEFAYGPAVRNGALVVMCDTDNAGFTRPMIEAMARIFVEELEPLRASVTLSVPLWSPGQPWTPAELAGRAPDESE